jgi:hypothetical protein
MYRLGEEGRLPPDPSASVVALVSGAGQSDRWALILAGGDGTRLLPLTREIAGDDRPRQFCAVVGDETLLDQTRGRVALSVGPEKTFFVLTRAHERFYGPALSGVPLEQMVGRVSAFLKMIRGAAPELFDRFDDARPSLHTPEEGSVMRTLYSRLAAAVRQLA